MNFKLKFIFANLFLTALLIACGGDTQHSKWSNNFEETNWRKSLTFYEKEKLSVSFLNNENNLKIVIASNDRSRMFQFIRQEFIVWFEQSVESSEKIGIKFPIRKMKQGSSFNKNRGNIQDQNPKEFFDRFIKEQNEFLIVNEENYPIGAYPLKNHLGIEPEIIFNKGQMIYSLEIPLNAISYEKNGIEYSPGEIIPITFEFKFAQRDKKNISGRGMGMRGGRKPSAGGMPTGKRGAGSGFSAIPEPVKISIDLLLASRTEN